MIKLILALGAALLCISAIAQDQGESALLLAVSSGAPTITYTSANCVGSASAAGASCTLAAAGAVGDLLIVKSKTASTIDNPTVTLTFSGTAACAIPTQVIAPSVSTWQVNGGGDFSAAMLACVITTAGATTPTVTWSGASASFTDIAVATYHTSTSWASSFVDQSAIKVATTSSTGCPTGTTAATTNDLIVAICDNFNVAETWGTLSGFTDRANSSRNTTGWYDTTVSATGVQSATIPLSSADYGAGMIVAFASN